MSGTAWAIVFTGGGMLLLIVVLAMIWWREQRNPLPPLWIDGEEDL